MNAVWVTNSRSRIRRGAVPTRVRRRRGFIVLVVMVVVAMVTLAGLSFVMSLSIENKAVHRQGDQLQLTEALASGGELLRAFCSQSARDRDDAGGTDNNAAVFAEVALGADDDLDAAVRLRVLSPDDVDAPDGTRHAGLQNESARLHLGMLVEWERRHPGSAQAALLQLPGMSETAAAAILDWLDADEQPRPQGAEADYYASRGLPYEPRNGVPAVLEELLLVRDVGRAALLGAEADLNVPDLADQSAVATAVAAATTVAGDVPWSRVLTIYSAERNVTYDGQPRINLNDPDLKRLHAGLTEAFDRSWADFVVAWRQYGPAPGEVARPLASGPRGPSKAARPTRATRGAPSPTDETQVDLSTPPAHAIESALDLVGAAVILPAKSAADRDEPRPALFCPLEDDPQALRDQLPRLADLTTTRDEQVVTGRVNINLAPRCVLLGIPGVDATLADRILASRGTVTSAADLATRHGLWLLFEGLVDRAAMRELWPYITGAGDVFRAELEASRVDAARAVRAEVVVDASQSPPRQVYWRTLPAGPRPESAR